VRQAGIQSRLRCETVRRVSSFSSFGLCAQYSPARGPLPCCTASLSRCAHELVALAPASERSSRSRSDRDQTGSIGCRKGRWLRTAR
jgi:hypothetical protein